MKKRRPRTLHPPPFTATHQDRDGNQVMVISFARHADTLSELVAYRDAHGNLWVLSRGAFYGRGSRPPRFTMLPEVKRAIEEAALEASRAPPLPSRFFK